MKQKKCQKMPVNFSCELCDFNCSKKSNYIKHLLTAKHKMKHKKPQKAPMENVNFATQIFLVARHYGVIKRNVHINKKIQKFSHPIIKSTQV